MTEQEKASLLNLSADGVKQLLKLSSLLDEAENYVKKLHERVLFHIGEEEVAIFKEVNTQIKVTRDGEIIFEILTMVSPYKYKMKATDESIYNVLRIEYLRTGDFPERKQLDVESDEFRIAQHYIGYFRKALDALK